MPNVWHPVFAFCVAGLYGAHLEQGLRGVGRRARRRGDGGGAHRPAAAPLPHREHPRQQLPDAGAPGPAGRDRIGPERAAGQRGMTGHAPPFAARRTPVASLPASGAQRRGTYRKDRSQTGAALPGKVSNFTLTKVSSFKLTVTEGRTCGIRDLYILRIHAGETRQTHVRELRPGCSSPGKEGAESGGVKLRCRAPPDQGRGMPVHAETRRVPRCNQMLRDCNHNSTAPHFAVLAKGAKGRSRWFQPVIYMATSLAGSMSRSSNARRCSTVAFAISGKAWSGRREASSCCGPAGRRGAIRVGPCLGALRDLDLLHRRAPLQPDALPARLQQSPGPDLTQGFGPSDAVPIQPWRSAYCAAAPK